jgi:hypothetical protein
MSGEGDPPSEPATTAPVDAAPAAPAQGLRATVAVGIAALVVVLAVGGGLLVARVVPHPSPPPTRVSITFAPTATPTPTPVDEATLFKQPVSSGCATPSSVVLVTDGGGLLRYDGTEWSSIDTTLRSLTRVRCSPTAAYAVGRVGSIVVVDEARKQILSTAFGIDDLFGVSAMADGTLMVGARGTVDILTGNDIQPYAAGIDEDLHDVVAFGLDSAWAVGQAGITYRLDQRGWNPVGSGQTNTLNAIAATLPANPLAVGDGGTIVRYDGGWQTVKSPVTATLFDVIVQPAVWIAGAKGTLLTGAINDLHAVDLHTTCDLVAVFAQGADIWVVGSSGLAGGGAWRLKSDGTVSRHWGGC